VAITPSSLLLPPAHPLHRIQRVAIGLGGLGIAGSIVLGFADGGQLLRSYLVAWLFWTGATLGCLGLLMINHVTGGGWGVVIRRALEAGARNLPVMGLLFLPIALQLGGLYEWAQPEHVHHDELLQHKALYLNVPFFLGRTVFYFVAWTLVVWGLVRWSTRQDEQPDPATDRMELISRGGLVLLTLTMTFAFVDWAMSLEAHWFSTIYSVIWMGGSALTAFAVVIPVAALFALREPTRGLVKREQVHDLGKLLLAFVILWTYFNLSQFLIIWSGNLPEETTWYLKRLRGGWQYLALVLVVFHFALPFVVLLSRPLKRDPRRLATVALLLLAVRFLDVFWLVKPAFAPEGIAVHVLDLTTVIALGGPWIWLFVRHLEGRPLLPLRDPSLPVLS